MFQGLAVSVVIPTWNEAAGISYTLKQIPSIVDEVVVVDALSNDGTADIARANGATVVPEARRGYGRAFKTGFDAAKGDLLVSADGDGTYPLHAIPDLLGYLLQHDKQFVTCTRFPLDTPGSMRGRNKFGNQVITDVASLFWMHRFTDILSGMWGMRKAAWRQLECVSDSWNFSEEIKIRAYKAFGDRFDEHRIHYAERLGETKLAPWRVGVENLVWLGLMRVQLDRILKARLRPHPGLFTHAAESPAAPPEGGKNLPPGEGQAP